MNMKKMAFVFAVGMAMGSAALAASAADAATKPAPQKPAAAGMMGHPHMHGAPDGCRDEGGYGHGMMGGDGMGMMGGYGGGMMGGGMMSSPRLAMVRSLTLSDEQRAKINKLSDQLQHDNWETMGAMMDESAKLRDLYEADRRDPAAIGKEYQKIFDLKRKMIEAMLTTQSQIEDLLTPEQRAQLKDMGKNMGAMYRHPMMH